MMAAPRYGALGTTGGELAKSKIPNAVERRHLIERDLGEAAALRYAEHP